MVWAPDPQAVGKTIDQLDTPCLLLDLDRLERNLDAMARFFADKPVRLRPHAKTHKTPNVARMQLERGAVGICCAKLGEAEVMAAGGISGILVTTEVVGPAKIRRLIGLAQQASVITVVDDAAAAQAVSDVAAAAGLRLRCLVDVDVGQHRTGVEPGESALDLALKVARMPGLELAGLQGYEGHAQHIVDPDERRKAHAAAMQPLCQTADLLAAHGLPTEIVSTGGTGTHQFAADYRAITEVQAGSYVVMDIEYGHVAGLSFESALTVLASVVSRSGTAAIVDAGYKSLSTDSGPPRAKNLDARYTPRGDEHGRLTFDSGNPLAIGDKVEITPSHCDTTINLHDLYYVTRDGRVVAVWPVAARGRVQ
ncbi:MAG: DSD1 family PLP-dependent enzyme [Chloroflexi bacterium]|nr:DSD1 family PLP-dependent enzyme [Chloroflexota bacterium]